MVQSKVGYLLGVTYILTPRVFGQKRRNLAPLSYPGLLDLAFECHGQQPRPYDVIGIPFIVDYRPCFYTKQNSLFSHVMDQS